MARDSDYACSFCGKGRDAIQRLIAGPSGVFICDECVGLCNRILAHSSLSTPTRGEAGLGFRLRRLLRGGRWQSSLIPLDAIAGRQAVSDPD